ncbi:MAG: class II D-tagatose-bisphosphate aldolase, non-catalytic subunit [Oscillospiraceae bacterium]|nr:class II D-tagatose-bisphosphate aldolase, non-catalytic subunit [Oscillospiraceae bacterium]
MSAYDLARHLAQGRPVCSACTSHPLAAEAVLEYARDTATVALIEATANQVNQYGGYTGMTPKDYMNFICALAEKTGNTSFVLGGDHLGPLVWTHLPERDAMAEAAELITQYAAAGFGKIHIDTSMRLANDPPRLTNDIIARRAAELCKAAERAAKARPPLYVIGSEVPVPGGSAESGDGVSVTKPEDFLEAIKTFKQIFYAEGLHGAWERVVAFVVQPGVEFNDSRVFAYHPNKAKKLIEALSAFAPLVFEGHSTDYQMPESLRSMADDGISILKVGPALTFALREGLFALCEMEKHLVHSPRSDFAEVLDKSMLDNPENWQKHYRGTPEEQAFKRKFSYSDRARYYLSVPEAERSMQRLMANINNNPPPLTLLSQYMPEQYRRVREGAIELTAEALVKDRIKDCLRTYPR